MGSGFGMEEVRNLGARFGIGSGTAQPGLSSGSAGVASGEALASAHRSFVSELRTILAEPAGWRGLWKGVGTGLVMSIPSASIYMLGYEYLLGWMGRAFDGVAGMSGVGDGGLGEEEKLPETLSDVERAVEEMRRRGEFSRQGHPSSQTFAPQHTVLTLSQPASANSSSIMANVPASTQQAYLSPMPFMAGSAARTISATVISPIELFRTRLQALPGREYLPLSRSLYVGTDAECLVCSGRSGAIVQLDVRQHQQDGAEAGVEEPVEGVGTYAVERCAVLW